MGKETGLRSAGGSAASGSGPNGGKMVVSKTARLAGKGATTVSIRPKKLAQSPGATKKPVTRVKRNGSSKPTKEKAAFRAAAKKVAQRRAGVASAFTGMESIVPTQAKVKGFVSGTPNRWQAAVWAKVQEVGRGRVSTYGDVANALGCPAHSRHVGKALGALPEVAQTFRGRPVPWWRIINSAGRISTNGSTQRRLLEAEGVTFAPGRGSVLGGMSKLRWKHKMEDLEEGLEES